MGIEATGVAEVERELREQAARVRAPGPALVAAAADLEAAVDASTSSGRAPDGSPWAPPVTTTRPSPGRPARPRHDRPGRQLGGLPALTTFVASSAGIVITNASSGARATQEGNARQVARRILPMDAGGRPTRGGDAGRVLAELPDRIAHYVTTGSVR
jgi:hypothetical protein